MQPPAQSRVSYEIQALELFHWHDTVSLTGCRHSLKLFLHAKTLLTVHLPGVLMESLNEVCLLVLGIQKEDRPVQVAISIQVHLGPRGIIGVEPI